MIWKVDLNNLGRPLGNVSQTLLRSLVSDKVGNVNRKGKHHSSIIGSPLIPITSLSNIVPPVMHITLGIVLKLFEMILCEDRKTVNTSLRPKKRLKRNGRLKGRR